MIGFFGALPKPGSFNKTPVETPPGGWPPFKGQPGPKQQKCTQQGGQWIGPSGKKWCQLTSPMAVVQPPVGGGGGGGGVVTPAPVDTAIVPRGEGGTPPGSPLLTDEQVVQDFITGGGGPAPMSAGAQATSKSAFSPLFVLGAVVVAGVVFFMWRGKKGSKIGGKRRK
jgi:hypothetical protein